ncbi:RNA polymerase sigma factor [Clostridium sp. P21]|uniref:RNA polymerase sigma factor n=1 Tax=Clostridium muellerianum TaxID=2716538 RepID=A0A7Y0EHH8_9CLOT|nr:RNA polymerase sigma factor [Clostridium muellerianum]NMM62545.1 RNA polymerase sigma factor [Clostridium muellerianum]
MDIELLINTYGTYVFNYALKLSCDPYVAEDLAQETFINAWQKIGTLENSDAIRAWLRKICFNNFLMKQRKNNGYNELLYEDINLLEKEEHLFVDNLPRPEDEVIVEEAVRDLQNGCFLAMVRRLTLHQRIAFSLVDMFGLSLEEVSEIIGISKSATKGLLYRAHMNLDSFFSEHCNILDVNNPCSCKAWIEFSKTRENLQKNSHKLMTKLDYTKSNYTFNKKVRGKINFLYKNMPDRKPQNQWYEKVVNVINEMYINKN